MSSAGPYRLPDGWALDPFDTAAVAPRYILSAGGRRWDVNGGTAALLQALATHDSLESAASELAHRWGRPVEPGALAAYLDRELVPAGMVVGPHTGETTQTVARGRLEFLTFRCTVIPARLLFGASRGLSLVFHPTMFWLSALAALSAAVWVLALAAARGESLLAAMVTPGAILGALASTLMHELGHAAACRRFGARHGDLGFGLYLVFPVFYMDVDETWKLPRGQRAVVDAGGLFLQVLFALALLLGSAVVPALHTAALGTMGLVGVALVVNLNPFFRFDGYWLASDLLGVPNLRQMSTEILRRGWHRLRHGGGRVLPAHFPARTAYALAGYGVLATAFFGLYFGRLLSILPGFATETYPRLAGAALQTAGESLRAGLPGHALAALLALVPATAMVVGIPLMVVMWLRRAVRSLLGRRRVRVVPSPPS